VRWSVEVRMPGGGAGLVSRKCVVVGDGGVGKTSLLATFATGSFPEEYVPTVFDNYVAGLTVGGAQYELGLFDTAGQEDYDRLRPLAYPRTDVFLVCFCVASMKSYRSVRDKWAPELGQHAPGVPVLLVATQADLRGGTEQRAGGRNQIPHELGKSLAREIGASKYLECSSKTRQGLERVFEEAVLASEGKGGRPGRRGLRARAGQCVLV